MSKVVKSVGKAIGSVVKGVTKVVKSVVKGVGKIVSKVAKSPIGRILLTAATVYFGGAALQGAFQGASAGSGFLGTLQGAIQGAGTGIANAWTGLTNAASSFMTGNFSQAGSQLASGAAGQALPAAADVAASGGLTNAQVFAQMGEGAAGALPAAGAAPAGVQAGQGMIGRAWEGLGQYGKAAAIQGAMQIGGGLVQGIGQQKALEDERRYREQQEAQARSRYNTNVGTALWGEQPAGGGTAPAGTSGDPYQPLYPAGGPAQVGTPLIASAMRPMSPIQFPVYNPAIFRTV